MKKFYITTPVYYINDKPHIGHAYSTIITDCLARYHRLMGDDTFFLTGTDENSLKNVEAAEKLGYTDIQAYLDMQSAHWQQTWDSLGISHNDFIRTTEERHKKGVEKFFRVVFETGDIYKNTYVGYYCSGCEEFIRETDIVENSCPIHQKPLKQLEEQNYFFKGSKYRDQLLSHIEHHPDFIQPAARRNEVVNYIRDHFGDISISRQSLEWGIPVPIDPGQVIYVWFDALVNYLTGIGYGWDDEMFQKYWPADIHIIGKEIIKFHCALWPAMLLSAGLPLPKHVFAHGWLTINGQKMSKSLGNAIDPVELATTYGLETVRYYLIREVPFGEDGDVSFDRISERYTADLSKGLGNFVSRVMALAAKIGDGITVPAACAEEQSVIESAWKTWGDTIEQFRPDESLKSIWQCISWGDKYIEAKKPWQLDSQSDEYRNVVSLLVEVVRHIGLMLYPFMPQTSEKISTQLGISWEEHMRDFSSARQWGAVKFGIIEKGKPLFPPLP